MNTNNTKQEENEKNLSNRKILKALWSLARPERKSYYLSLFFMILALGFDLSKPFLLNLGLEKITIGNLPGLKNIALIFLTVLVIEYIFRSAFTYIIALAFFKTITRIREAVFAHVISLPLAFYDRQPVGALLTRTINDTESLGETLRAGLATILVDILTIIGLFVVMTQINLALTPVMFVSAPIVWLVVRWFGKKLRSSYLKVRKELARSNAYMAEGISGVEVVQVFNQEETSGNQFEKINREYRNATIHSNIYDASLYAIVDGIAFLVTAAIIYWGFGLHFGLIEVSAIIVYIDLISRIFIPIRDLSGKFATIQQAMAALQRVFSILLTEEKIPSGDKKLSGRDLEIQFSDVSFRYQPDKPMVLKNISFEVKTGQVVALVGATGSGKSTIIKLLTRAYEGYTGHIYANQIELTEVQISQLRSRIAMVQQDIFLFPGTLRDNITLGNPNITEQDIEDTLEIVKLAPIVKQLPGGLDFPVKEGASNLSSGQAQLIVFARAMAHNCPVVVMDEATSNIDSLTEGLIQEALEEILKRRTVIIIAHRLSTISKADQILVMRDGCIIERGKHEELLGNEGYYAELVQAMNEEETTTD